MSPLARLLAALLPVLARLLGRWLARWYARREPRVRELLLRGRALPPPAGPLLVLRVPESRPGDAGYWTDVASSTQLIRGREPRAGTLARVRILPAAVAVDARPAWQPRPLRRPLRATRIVPARPGERAATLVRDPATRSLLRGAARPAIFGVDERTGRSRAERRPLPLCRPAIRPRRAPARSAFAPLRRPTLPVFDARKLGLAEDATPPTELAPVEPRRPPRQPPARATFVANYVEPARGERVWKDYPTTLGETVRDRIESSDGPELGATAVESTWDVEELQEPLQEVREQFLLRRDVDKLEREEDELGKLANQLLDLDLQSMYSFTGVEFMDLQPEPVEPLRMRLENPPVSMEPSIAEPAAQLDALVKAMLSHGEPPVPEVASPRNS